MHLAKAIRSLATAFRPVRRRVFITGMSTEEFVCRQRYCSLLWKLTFAVATNVKLLLIDSFHSFVWAVTEPLSSGAEPKLNPFDQVGTENELDSSDMKSERNKFQLHRVEPNWFKQVYIRQSIEIEFYRDKNKPERVDLNQTDLKQTNLDWESKPTRIMSSWDLSGFIDA